MFRSPTGFLTAAIKETYGVDAVQVEGKLLIYQFTFINKCLTKLFYFLISPLHMSYTWI